MPDFPRPPFPNQHQPMPGKTAAMKPAPDHGEMSYKGSGRLGGKKAVITGGDSGIGRAVAIAYAREGADILISYLNEHDDARETERLVAEAGRKAVLLPGDIQDPGQCRAVIAKAVSDLGGIDILVNNAAHQASFKSIDDISDAEWELTFKVNIHAMFYLTKAAISHMKPGQLKADSPVDASLCGLTLVVPRITRRLTKDEWSFLPIPRNLPKPCTVIMYENQITFRKSPCRT